MNSIQVYDGRGKRKVPINQRTDDLKLTGLHVIQHNRDKTFPHPEEKIDIAVMFDNGKQVTPCWARSYLQTYDYGFGITFDHGLGVPTGWWEFHGPGRLQKGTLKDGKRHGCWYSFDEDTTVLKRNKWVNRYDKDRGLRGEPLGWTDTFEPAPEKELEDSIKYFGFDFAFPPNPEDNLFLIYDI